MSTRWRPSGLRTSDGGSPPKPPSNSHVRTPLPSHLYLKLGPATYHIKVDYQSVMDFMLSELYLQPLQECRKQVQCLLFLYKMVNGQFQIILAEDYITPVRNKMSITVSDLRSSKTRTTILLSCLKETADTYLKAEPGKTKPCMQTQLLPKDSEQLGWIHNLCWQHWGM